MVVAQIDAPSKVSLLAQSWRRGRFGRGSQQRCGIVAKNASQDLR